MANMFPPEFPEEWREGKYAESVVFDALREGLDEDWFVYHSLSFIDDQRYTQGEADFVVLHRTKGMLVIECKGKGVRRDNSGNWLRRDDSGRETEASNPFAQAEGTLRRMIGKLAPALMTVFKLGEKQFPFVHGHAVIFPLALADKVCPTPLDQPPTIVYDASDLDRIGARVNDTLAFWKKKAGAAAPKPLDEDQFQRFRKKVLFPSYGIVNSLGGMIKADDRTMLRLSAEQVKTFECVMDNPLVCVKGGAGTGKTILAIEVARRLSDQGAKVLLLCFNAALADFLRSSLKRDGYGDKIAAFTFPAIGKLAWHALGHSEMPIPPEKDARSRFWNDEVPYYLVEAIDKEKIPRYDAIVVDEGQDFRALWWEIIVDQMRPSKLVVFYDPAQVIFGNGGTVPKGVNYELRCNYRNTVKIAEIVNRLAQKPLVHDARCPVGEEPELREQGNDASLKSALKDIATHLLKKQMLRPDQIAILSPHTHDNSSLAKTDTIAGCPLASRPQDREGRILHCSIGAFKGLESDILILVDIDPAEPLCDRNLRYVATSRAKHKLYVFYKGDWLNG